MKDGCGPLANDVQVQGAGRPGRTAAPHVRIPINAINPDGIAGPIANLPGPAVQLGSGDSIDVADSSFQPSKVVVRPGSVLRWSFLGPDLHTVTVANGPQGFASPNLRFPPTMETSCSPAMLAPDLMRPPATRLCSTRLAASRSMLTVSG